VLRIGLKRYIELIDECEKTTNGQGDRPIIRTTWKHHIGGFPSFSGDIPESKK